MKKFIPYPINGENLTPSDLLQIIERYLSEIEESLIGDLTYFS
ncbi:hypothetical protein ACP3TB_14560 [Rahnella variigena]|nr:hypothetical protein [Rahnella variigena]MDH2894915.1 hypothetical protein [Rahnella variigena]